VHEVGDGLLESAQRSVGVVLRHLAGQILLAGRVDAVEGELHLLGLDLNRPHPEGLLG
jgi:hypothetical protein